jgi:hypothetical protein
VAAFHQRDVDLVESLLRAHNQSALAAYNKFLLAAGHLNGGKGKR